MGDGATEEAPGLPKEVVAQIDATAESLTSTRRKRKLDDLLKQNGLEQRVGAPHYGRFKKSGRRAASSGALGRCTG